MPRQSQIIQPSQDELLRALTAGQTQFDPTQISKGVIQGEDLANTILKNKQAQEDRVRTLAEKIKQAKMQKDFARQVGAGDEGLTTALNLDPAQGTRQYLEQKFTERAAKAPKTPTYTKIGETEDEIILADLSDPSKQFRVKAPGVGKTGKSGGDPKLARDREVKRASTIIAKANEALGKIGMSTTGAGGLLAKVPQTEARNLKGVLDTIKANLGFAELEKMRQASPTGGALGQIAVKELDFLQSVEGSMDQLQDPEQVTKVVTEIRDSYQRWLDAVNQSNQAPGNPGSPAPTGNPGTTTPNIDVNALGTALGLPRKR